MITESAAKRRQASRDSMFLTTDVLVQGAEKAVTVLVRNLSPGGMMIDSNPVFQEGALLTAAVRGIGTLTGKIAWIIEERAGVSFDEEIDPKEARAPVSEAKLKGSFTPQPHRSRRPGLKLR